MEKNDLDDKSKFVDYDTQIHFKLKKIYEELCNSNHRFKLINIEGIDATGKNTVVNYIIQKCNESNIPCMKLDFPNYDSIHGQIIKDLLTTNSNGYDEELDTKQRYRTLIYITDRLKVINGLYFDLLNNDKRIVVSNRSYLSMFMYCGYKFFVNEEGYFDHKQLCNVNRIKEFIREFVEPVGKMEMTYEWFYGNMNNFYLFHPNIKINQALMEKRGGIKDKNEIDDILLRNVHEFALCFENARTVSSLIMKMMVKSKSALQSYNSQEFCVYSKSFADIERELLTLHEYHYVYNTIKCSENMENIFTTPQVVNTILNHMV